MDLQSPNMPLAPATPVVYSLPIPSNSARGPIDAPRPLTSSGSVECESLSVATPVGSSPELKRQHDSAADKAQHERTIETKGSRTTSPDSALASPGRNGTSSSRFVGRFTSKKVRLPSTVEDLISSYEALYERHETQKAQLDLFYREVSHLAEGSSPFSSVVRKEVLRVAGNTAQAEGGPPSVSVITANRALSAEPLPPTPIEGNGVPVVCGKVLPSKGGATPSNHTSLKGNVVGTVVVPPREGARSAEAANESSGSFQGGVSRTSVEETQEEAEGERVGLRAKGLAMEAAGVLLASARVEVRQLTQERARLEADLIEAHEQFRKVEAENATLRSALQTKATECNGLVSLGEEQLQHLVTLLEASAWSAHDLKSELKSKKEAIDCLEYRETQLKAQLETLYTQNAFLKEKSAQLEGQLHRLLSGDAMHGMNSKAMTASTKLGQSGANTSAAAGGGKGTQPGSNAAHQLTPLQRYNAETLQKQIDDLRSIVDRLHKSNSLHEATRAKLETQLHALTKENTTLKRDFLEYRRKVNDMELNLENEASLKTYEERCRSAEKETIRLRQALRERKESFDRRMLEARQRLNLLETQNTLYGRAVKHLLTRCVFHTIELLAQKELSGRCREASSRRVDVAGDAPQTVLACSVKEEEPTQPTCAGDNEQTHDTHNGSGKNDAAVAVVESAIVGGQSASPLAPAVESIARPAATVSGPAAALELSSTTTSHELFPSSVSQELFSGSGHSLEGCCAASKGEVRRLEQLNRELRQALGRSQEELRGMARRLARAADPPRRHASVGCDFPPREESIQSNVEEHSQSTLEESGRGIVEAATRVLREVGQRYHPEDLNADEAVQLENAALLARLVVLQEEKWAATTRVEALQSDCAALREELRRVLSARNGAPQVDTVATQLSGLQNLLQETLAEKLELEERVQIMQSQTCYRSSEDECSVAK